MRLSNMKELLLGNPSHRRQPYDFLLLLDLVPTLLQHEPADFTPELLEVSAALLRCPEGRLADGPAAFRSLVRPQARPRLSPLCVRRTGITQELADAAPTFPEVWAGLVLWLGAAAGTNSVLVCTVGNRGLGELLPCQWRLSGMPGAPPEIFSRWSDLGESVSSVTGDAASDLGQMAAAAGEDAGGGDAIAVLAAIARKLVRVAEIKPTTKNEAGNYFVK